MAFVLTFAQVALGFRILAIPDPMLAMAHQGIAIVILVLLAVGGMLAARSRRKSMAQIPATALRRQSVPCFESEANAF